MLPVQLHAQLQKTQKKNVSSMELSERDTCVFLLSKMHESITRPTVWNSIPPNGGRSLSTRMYCSFPWRGGTCQ